MSDFYHSILSRLFVSALLTLVFLGYHPAKLNASGSERSAIQILESRVSIKLKLTKPKLNNSDTAKQNLKEVLVAIRREFEGVGSIVSLIQLAGRDIVIVDLVATDNRRISEFRTKMKAAKNWSGFIIEESTSGRAENTAAYNHPGLLFEVQVKEAAIDFANIPKIRRLLVQNDIKGFSIQGRANPLVFNIRASNIINNAITPEEMVKKVQQTLNGKAVIRRVEKISANMINAGN